jgi:hypothetical protein
MTKLFKSPGQDQIVPAMLQKGIKILQKSKYWHNNLVELGLGLGLGLLYRNF